MLRYRECGLTAPFVDAGKAVIVLLEPIAKGQAVMRPRAASPDSPGGPLLDSILGERGPVNPRLQ